MMRNQAKTAVNNLLEIEESFFLSLSDIASAESNLCCIDGKIIGTGRPDYTQSSTEYSLFVDDNEFLLIDIPGIEGNEEKFKEIIKNSLMKSHVIFYVNGSGKKAEKDTLEKIKNYMHDETSVYAIFNVHCKAQKDRLKGIDKTYQEELSEAYKKQKSEIVPQTEAELKLFLGDNFKGSVCVNGLLSFCAMAIDDYGYSTIAKDEDKNLRSTQTKFLKEYADNLSAMRDDCAIREVQNIITEKIAHFDEYILEENLKKLRKRLSDVLSDITGLRDKEKSKIKNFLREYDTFEKNCETAKDDFIQTIRRIGRLEVATAFIEVQEELFTDIELCKGKINSSSVESILNKHKDQISVDIQNAINNKITSAAKEYQESVAEAEARLLKDLQRNQMKFEIAMSSEKMYFDSSFSNGLGFDVKGLTKGAFKIAGYTFSGFTIGSLFPGIGNIIGAAIGFIAGIGFAIWEFFTSEAKRINKAKERLKQAIDDQVDEIAEDVKEKIKNLNIESIIEDKHSEITKTISTQKRSLHDIERVLDIVVTELSNRYKKV